MNLKCVKNHMIYMDPKLPTWTYGSQTPKKMACKLPSQQPRNCKNLPSQGDGGCVQGVLPFECESRFRFKRPWESRFYRWIGGGGESFRDLQWTTVRTSGSPWPPLVKKRVGLNKFHHFLYSIEIYYHFCPNGSWLPGVTFSIARQLRSHSNLLLTEVPF